MYEQGESDFGEIESFTQLWVRYFYLARERPFEEWRARTTFGRLLYPGYLLRAGFTWIVGGIILLIVSIWIELCYRYRTAKLGKRFPPVYKEDSR